MRALAAAALVLAGLGPSGAGEVARESVYRERFCAGMEQSHRFADQTVADCLSEEFAIEVDFTAHWYEALGQALHYAGMSGKRAGIILVCESPPATCLARSLRLQEVIAGNRLAITVWQCGVEMDSLDDCRLVGPSTAI